MCEDRGTEDFPLFYMLSFKVSGNTGQNRAAGARLCAEKGPVCLISPSDEALK